VAATVVLNAATALSDEGEHEPELQEEAQMAAGGINAAEEGVLAGGSVEERFRRANGVERAATALGERMAQATQGALPPADWVLETVQDEAHRQGIRINRQASGYLESRVRQAWFASQEEEEPDFPDFPEQTDQTNPDTACPGQGSEGGRGEAELMLEAEPVGLETHVERPLYGIFTGQQSLKKRLSEKNSRRRVARVVLGSAADRDEDNEADEDDVLWAGDVFKDTNNTDKGGWRIAFMNLRRIKRCARGNVEESEMWRVLKQKRVDIAGLADHGLEVDALDPKSPGKSQMASSGKAAANAEKLWGGKGMSWAVAQGIKGGRGAEGAKLPEGGTLMAVHGARRHLVEHQLTDPTGWGRWAGVCMEGTAGAKDGLVVVEVYAPVDSRKPGTAWQRQMAAQAVLDEGGAQRQGTPREWLYADLHAQLRGYWAHPSKAYDFIIGGDFNEKWNMEKKMDTKMDLRGLVASLGMGNVMTRRHGEQFYTYRQSDKKDAATTCIDHVFASESLLADGIVKAGVLQGRSLNCSDHRACFIEVDLTGLLGLDTHGQRLPPVPEKEYEVRLSCGDDAMVAAFQEHLLEHAQAAGWDEMIQQVEAGAEAWRECGEPEAKAVRQAKLQQTMNATMNVGLGLMRRAEADTVKAENKPTTHKVRRGRKKDGSPELSEVKQRLTELSKIHGTCDNGHWSAGLERAARYEDQHGADLGAKEVLRAVAQGTGNWRPLAKGWLPRVEREKERVKNSSTKETREAWWKAQAKSRDKTAELRALMQWGKILKQHKRERRSPTERDMLVVGEGEGRQVITDPDKVKAELRRFFSSWYGVGRNKWYQTWETTEAAEPQVAWIHPLMRRSPDGWASRKRVVEGGATAVGSPERAEHEKWLEGFMEKDHAGEGGNAVPERCRWVLREYGRKFVASLGRRIQQSDYIEKGVTDPISEHEWEEVWKAAPKGKASDYHGTHNDLFKAMGKSVVHGKARGGGRRDEEAQPPECKTLELLHAFRRLVNVTLDTEVVCEQWAQETLVTLPKVPGSMAIRNTRPIGLVAILRNTMMGILSHRVQRVWAELKALAALQHGFVKGQNGDQLRVRRIIVFELKFETKGDVASGTKDEEHAFDTPPWGGLEMDLMRLAVPDKIINLGAKCNEQAVMYIRVVGGHAEPMKRGQTWSETEHAHRGAGNGCVQGGKESPTMTWVAHEDFVLTYWEQTAIGIPVQTGDRSYGTVKGGGFADDKSFLEENPREMSRTYGVTNDVSELSGGVTNVKKSQVQIQQYMRNWRGNITAAMPKERDDIEPVTMTVGAEGREETVPMVQADDSVVMLGEDGNVRCFWGAIVETAHIHAMRAAQIMRVSRMAGWLATLFYKNCLGAALKYKLKLASIAEREFKACIQPAWTEYKRRVRLARSTSNHLTAAMGVGNIWEELQVERVMMMIKQLNGKCQETKTAWAAYIYNYQRQKGECHEPILSTKATEGQHYTGTLIERIHLHLSSQGVTVTGGESLKIPFLREGDVSLMDICPDDMKGQVQEVCRRNRRWTLAAWVSYEGVWLRDTGQFGGDAALIDEELGGDWNANEVREFWFRTVREKWTAAAAALGPWRRQAIQIGATVAWREARPRHGGSEGARTIELGRVVRFEADGRVQVRKWRPTTASEVAKHLRGRDDSQTGWEHDEKGGDVAQYWLEERRSHMPTIQELRKCSGDIAVAEAPMPEFAQEGDIVMCEEDEVQPVTVAEVTKPGAEEITWEVMDAPDALEGRVDEREQREDAAGANVRPTGSPDAATEAYEGRMELVGWDRLTQEEKDAKVQTWLSMVREARATGENAELWSYSDGSKKGDGIAAVGSYAWGLVPAGSCAATVIQGGGVIHGHPVDISSTRAERLGVLAALTGMQVLREWAMEGGAEEDAATWPGLHEHRLDNKGTVDSAEGKWDTGGGSHTDVNEADFDVTAQMEAVREDVSPRLRLVWQRGHPERVRQWSEFTAHERRIFDVDADAEDAYEIAATAGWALREDWWRFPTRPEWGLMIGSREIKGNMAQQLKGLAQRTNLEKYWIKKDAAHQLAQQGPDEELSKAADLRECEKDATIAVRKWIDRDVMWETTMPRQAAKQILQIKCVGDLLRDATMEGYGRAQEMTCQLCKKHVTGSGGVNAHITWHCQGDAGLVEARETMRANLSKALVKGGVNETDHPILNVPWLIEEETEEDLRQGIDGSMEEEMMNIAASEEAKAAIEWTLKGRSLYKTRSGFVGDNYVKCMESLGMGKGNAKKTAAALAKVVREARMQAWRAYVHATHGGEEEDEHKQSEEYKEHERAWAELLDKMVGWVYTLNEAAAEGTDTRVTMEEVRRTIESQRIPAGKQSHKRRREWMARVAEEVEHGIIDEEIACMREMVAEARHRDAQEKEEASKKAKKRKRPRKGAAANAAEKAAIKQRETTILEWISNRAGTSAAEAELGSDEGGDEEGIPGNREDGKGRRGVGGPHACRYRQPDAPGRIRRRIEKERKGNETRRKAAEEQAADMVDTEQEDGDETEGEGNEIRGARRGKRGTRQQVIDDSDTESDSDGETRSQKGGRNTRRQEERQADKESDVDEEPGEQHGGRSGLEARRELSATGAQDAPT